MTGNKIFEVCNSSSDLNFGECIGYIKGAADGVELTDYASVVSKVIPRSQLCLPQTATAGQVKDVFMKYLTDHPEMRHIKANQLMMVALKTAFPCPGT